MYQIEVETHGGPQARHVQDVEDEPATDDQAAGLAPPAEVYSPGPGQILHHMYYETEELVLVEYCVRGCVTLHIAFQ